MSADFEKLNEQINLRLGERDLGLLDSITELVPMPRAAVARAALRRGLAQIAADPALLVRGER